MHTLSFPFKSGLLSLQQVLSLFRSPAMPHTLRSWSKALKRAARRHPAHASAFLPFLRNMPFGEPELRSLLAAPSHKLILADDDTVKAVCILWLPGASTPRHGHPEGGGVYGVLHGRLKERRFRPGQKDAVPHPGFLREGDMAYIDDTIAEHEVCNPFDEYAVSLHIYARHGKNKSLNKI